VITISQEPPPYLICPNCKEKIIMDYSKKSWPQTADIYSMRMKTPYYFGTKKPLYDSITLSICNHCKVILGIGKED